MATRRKPFRDTFTRLHPLKQWRLYFGVTQQELSRQCQIGQSHLSKIEHFDQVPIRDMLERLKSYTGLPTDALVRPRQFLEEDPDFLSRTRGPA